MEKFSKWRDPSTGIQPFVPLVTPTASPIFTILLTPFSAFHSIIRSTLLLFVGALYILLDTLSRIFKPIPPLHRTLSWLFTAFTCRLALCLMGYWWIETDIASPRRGVKGVTQTCREVKPGDLIISNWTSYVDVLYLAFRYNPVFLLPVFEPIPEAFTPKISRRTGTGSASIFTPSNLHQPSLLGYSSAPLFSLLAQTGSTFTSTPTYKTLRDARCMSSQPIVLFPESTTSNGRAILRFPPGLLSQDDMGSTQKDLVWIKHFKHSSPTAFSPSATCPLPRPVQHIFWSLLWTPTPFPSRTLTVRTLHPSAAPSSPSFLPSEILAATPGGIELAGRDGSGAWREACAVVLAETGRVRRVRLGWVEKDEFLGYWSKARR